MSNMFRLVWKKLPENVPDNVCCSSGQSPTLILPCTCAVNIPTTTVRTYAHLAQYIVAYTNATFLSEDQFADLFVEQMSLR